MKFVDAHIHLTDPEYNKRVAEIIEEAKKSNVVAIVSSSMNLESSVSNMRLTEENQGLVYASLGIHPWNVRSMDTDELQQMLNLISQHKKSKGRVVAVGEIGLDPLYGKRRELRDLQVKVFTEMLHAAEKASLPVVIHSRLSAQRIMDILSSFNLGGVLFHWFSNPIELLPQMIERGYYVSEGPPAVFSAKTQEVIRHVPLTHLLTETDGPVRYFGPFKDKLTTPALIPQVVKSIAGIKRIKESDVADQVLENLINLFKIEKLRPVVSSLP